jgi:nitrate reductase assembly molybdenum cofactor insertion protein NarJ
MSVTSRTDEEMEAKLEDVAALLRRVAGHLPQNDLLYIQVIDYLRRHKLTGKILRAEKEANK